jgi:hypothetical protein
MTARADCPEPGPSLSTYIETRFNLLTESLKDKLNAQDIALLSSSEAAKAAVLAAKAAAEAASQASDLRYQQRFEAQSDALSAAFLSQQTAMQTALKTAQEAVQAALAAADRAVSKAELAADKRFEALNELRQMLNTMVASLITRSEADTRFGSMTEKIDANSKRLDGLDARLNLASGEQQGHRRTKDDTRAYIAIGISIIIVVMAVATFILARIGGS